MGTKKIKNKKLKQKVWPENLQEKPLNEERGGLQASLGHFFFIMNEAAETQESLWQVIARQSMDINLLLTY